MPVNFFNINHRKGQCVSDDADSNGAPDAELAKTTSFQNKLCLIKAEGLVSILSIIELFRSEFFKSVTLPQKTELLF